jgi:hypothetical protein
MPWPPPWLLASCSQLRMLPRKRTTQRSSSATRFYRHAVGRGCEPGSPEHGIRPQVPEAGARSVCSDGVKAGFCCLFFLKLNAHLFYITLARGSAVRQDRVLPPVSSSASPPRRSPSAMPSFGSPSKALPVHSSSTTSTSQPSSRCCAVHGSSTSPRPLRCRDTYTAADLNLPLDKWVLLASIT